MQQIVSIALIIGVLALIAVTFVIFNNDVAEPAPTPPTEPTFTTNHVQETTTNLNPTPNKTNSMPTNEPSDADIQPINQKVTAVIKTSLGDIKIELDGTRAPITVGNFIKLAQDDFYDGVTFHRVIPDFMVQTGDPNSKDPSQRSRHGTGGPGYTFADEFNDTKLIRGSLAMANSGPNTNGSQFFIVTAATTPFLDGVHTNFGTVLEGMDVINSISAVERDKNDNPLTPITIIDIIIPEFTTTE